MPVWPQSKIKCFYCGRSSKHRKGEKLSSFQCSQCEGTNYLDEAGNITDVPSHVSGKPSQITSRLAARPQASATYGAGDSTFCAQCIKNQRILNDCVANYLPQETDPRYEEFVAGFDKYKKDLERRYPQVCPRCEAKVKERLKKNTYLAQSDSFHKTLARSIHDPRRRRTGLKSSLMAIVKAAWWTNLLLQGTWHLLGALGRARPSRERADMGGASPDEDLASCLRSLRSLRSSGLSSGLLVTACGAGLDCFIYLSFVCSFLLLWWNPAITKHNQRLSVGKGAFSLFQMTMLFVRWFSWYCIKDSAWTLGRRETQGIQLVVVVLTLFTSFATYRVVTRSQRYKIVRRDFNAPLVDKDSFQYPSDNSLSQPVTPDQHGKRFEISGLRAINGMRQSPAQAPVNYKPSAPSDITPMEDSGDAMDWEPNPPQSKQHTFDLRSRPAAAVPKASKPFYPATSAFSAFPIQPGQNPFHGSLPPAPKSMEAKLRASARQPPPQFKPISDAKQADWFKRMGLAQSSTSWTNQKYVHTAKKSSDLPEFAEGTLKIHEITGRKADGTGLEEMFVSSFKLDDREESPEKEVTVTQTERSSSESLVLLIGMCGIALLLIMLFQFAPELWQRLLDTKDLWLDRGRQMAYGQGFDVEPPMCKP